MGRLVSAFIDKIVAEGSGIAKTFRELHGEPNFSMFIDEVRKRASNDNFNIHWEPYVSSCDFCSFNYTVISKLETAKEDMEMILRLAGVDSDLLEIEAMNMKVGESIEEATKRLFSELTREQGKALEEIYKYDLWFFAYDAEKYLEVTQG